MPFNGHKALYSPNYFNNFKWYENQKPPYKFNKLSSKKKAF